MKILLPVDGSELSLQAVRMAIALLGQGLSGSVVVANVQEPATLYEMVVAPDGAVLQRVSTAAGIDALQRADQPVDQVVLGDPDAGFVACRGVMVEGDLGKCTDRTAVQDGESSCRMTTGVEQVAGALPCRDRLAGQQTSEPVVVAVIGELFEVRDKVRPRGERRWSCGELHDECFWPERLQPVRPGDKIQPSTNQQLCGRREQGTNRGLPADLHDGDVAAQPVG